MNEFRENYDRNEIKAAKEGTHTISLQPGHAEQATVVRVRADRVRVALEDGTELWLNGTASRMLMNGDYR